MASRELPCPFPAVSAVCSSQSGQIHCGPETPHLAVALPPNLLAAAVGAGADAVQHLVVFYSGRHGGCPPRGILAAPRPTTRTELAAPPGAQVQPAAGPRRRAALPPGKPRRPPTRQPPTELESYRPPGQPSRAAASPSIGRRRSCLLALIGSEDTTLLSILGKYVSLGNRVGVGVGVRSLYGAGARRETPGDLGPQSTLGLGDAVPPPRSPRQRKSGELSDPGSPLDLSTLTLTLSGLNPNRRVLRTW